jgi:hypothetical protein
MCMRSNRRGRSILAACFFLSTVLVRMSLCQESRLDIRCPISGLDVLVDGVSVGKTPLGSIPCSPGVHSVRVISPDPDNWLSRDWETRVAVDSGATVVLETAFPRRVWVGSDPPGAVIIVEGILQGSTPSAVDLPPDRSVLIMLRKTGYEDEILDPRNEMTSLLTVLTPQSAGLPKSLFRTSNEASRMVRAGWVSGIVAVISGVTGYFLKREADREYDRYLGEVYVDSMNRHYQDSQTLDRWAFACYGLGEVVFGISLYFWIRSSWSSDG